MIRSRKVQAGIGMIALALVIPLLVAMGNTQSDAGMDDAFTRDARAYADETEVTLEEAKRRLNLQEEIGNLRKRLAEEEGSTFGGLWTEHSPDYRVVAAFTESGSETLERYQKSAGLAEAIQVKSVDTTLSSLMATQSAADLSSGRTPIATESAVIVKDNVVEVYTLDKEGLKRALDNAGESFGQKVVVKEVSELSSPAHGSSIHGGEHVIGDDGLGCTTGFAVQEVIDYDDGDPVYGETGITTAGHCHDSQSRGTLELTYEDGDVGGSVDVQWHTAAGYTPDNVISFGSSYHRSITSERHRSSQGSGDWVCKYGWNTGQGCGWIVTTSFRPKWGGYDWNKTWVRVRNPSRSLAAPGDSGGPWYLGNTAYGTTSAWNRPRSAAHNEAVYMAINYLSLQDLDLLTD